VMAASHKFRFVIDRLCADAPDAVSRPARGGRVGRERAGPEVVDVPADGPSCLVVGQDGKPRCVRPADAPADAPLVEPVTAGSQPELVLVSRAGRRVRVNGQPAPLVALVGDRDQVQLSEDLILHVTTYHEPRIGPPSDKEVGRTCPVCRTVITPQSTVYVCWCCGAPMHLEGEGRLDCARVVSECANCRGAKVLLKSQYTSLPEDLVHE